MPQIQKLTAARNQLATAIELWFYDKDQVSVHTLAFAAYEIIHHVSEKMGRNRELLFDSIVIKGEYKKEFLDATKKAANFFKHGSRDPNAIIEFNPTTSEFFIMFAILGINAVGLTLDRQEQAFTWWYWFNHPELFLLQNKLLDEPIHIDDINGIRSFSKSEFFENFLNS